MSVEKKQKPEPKYISVIDAHPTLMDCMVSFACTASDARPRHTARASKLVLYGWIPGFAKALDTRTMNGIALYVESWNKHTQRALTYILWHLHELGPDKTERTELLWDSVCKYSHGLTKEVEVISEVLRLVRVLGIENPRLENLALKKLSPVALIPVFSRFNMEPNYELCLALKSEPQTPCSWDFFQACIRMLKTSSQDDYDDACATLLLVRLSATTEAPVMHPEIQLVVHDAYYEHVWKPALVRYPHVACVPVKVGAKSDVYEAQTSRDTMIWLFGIPFDMRWDARLTLVLTPKTWVSIVVTSDELEQLVITPDGDHTRITSFIFKLKSYDTLSVTWPCKAS